MNIAPGPKGDFDQVGYDRMKDLADWMKINGSAVFATRTIAPFHQGDYYYTRSKDNKEINVFHLSEGDVYQKTAEYVFEVPENFKVGQLHILGHKGKLKWSQQGNQVHVQRPATDLKYAATIQLHSK